MANPNKTQTTEASVSEFFAQIESDARRAEAVAILAQFEAITQVKAKMWGPSIVGFGVHHYRYESGREGTSPMVAFSPRKAQLVLYGLGGETIDPQVAVRLGKHSTGKGCLYIKKLSDVNQEVLGELIAQGWNRQGQPC